jgi:tetratricopeptide (TPR) repeat protein
VTVYVDRAVLAFSEKRYDDALNELDQALRLNAASHEALYYKGLIFQELNRPAEARDALERANRLRPANADIAFQLGVLHIRQQEFDKAEPLIRQAYRADKKRPNAGYYLGLIEYKKGNYRSAVEYFDTNNPSDDAFAQLNRFYSGLAASALGFPRRAQTEMSEALRLRTGSSVANAIPRLSDSLDKRAQNERRFRGEVQFGFVYDSDAALVLDQTTSLVPIQDGSNEISLIATGRKSGRSTGELISGSLSYNWLRTLDWDGNAGYRFTHIEYNQAADFSNQTHNPWLSVIKSGVIFSLPYFAGLFNAYENISVGHKTALQRWTVNPYLTLIENANNVGNLQFRFQAKNYSPDPFIHKETRDALNYMVGPTHYFQFDNGRHFVKLGYQYDREFAQGRNWEYIGNRLLIGGQYTLPWQEIRLRYDFDQHWRNYRHVYNVSPFDLDPAGDVRAQRRRDREGVHTVSLAKDFAVSAQKFNAALEYVYDNARSNQPAFRFSRHIVIPSITWRF